MDYGKLCSELLELDEKIRYVGVYNSFSGDVFEKMQGGISRHFDKDQTRKSFPLNTGHKAKSKKTTKNKIPKLLFVE